MFVMSLRYVCDVIAMAETGRFQNWLHKYIYFKIIISEWTFYIGKWSSQFYYLIT